MSLIQWNLRGVSIDLKMNNLDLVETQRNSKHYRRAHVHIYIYCLLYIRDGICQNLSFLKHFWWERLHGKPCCCLNVSIYMLKCVFYWVIVLENEFKRCVYLGTNNNSSWWSLSKFVVSKHVWWEFLHGEPCFRLDIYVYMLKYVFCGHILLQNGFKWYVAMR